MHIPESCLPSAQKVCLPRPQILLESAVLLFILDLEFGRDLDSARVHADAYGHTLTSFLSADGCCLRLLPGVFSAYLLYLAENW